MSDKTKAVNLTEDELMSLLQYHAKQIAQSGPAYDEYVDRINYLNKRLKSFKEPETEIKSDPQFAADAKGWGNKDAKT